MSPRLAPLLPRIIVSASLAMAITVALAWLIALYPPKYRGISTTPTKTWMYPPQASWPPAPSTRLLWGARGFRIEERHGSVAPSSYEISTMYQSTIATGWPLPALAAREDIQVDIANRLNERRWRRAGVVLHRKIKQSMSFYGDPALGRALSTIPVWPGLALDTLLYTGLILALWAAPASIRRRLRRARGRCPACGYDLKGAPSRACPECGA